MVHAMTEDAVPKTREFGDYHVYDELGHGGIGDTFVARLQRDTAAGLERFVCLKIMGREFQAARGERRNQAIESLRHEARIVAGFQHPNIARLVDSGCYNDVWFVAFELITGANLDEILAMRRLGEGLEPEHVRRIGIQVASALQCAHERRVLHRDVKPGNILISTDGRVKLVDFGLAKAIADASAEFTVGVGTPRYWAPEQVMQDSLTEATDLYALGIVLYELLTTVHPSHASTPEEFRRNIVRGHRKPLTDFGVPEDLAMIVECCLQTDPADRFLSAKALHTALRSGAKVSGFEFEIGELADAAYAAVAEQRILNADRERGSESHHPARSTVHASQEGPTNHMPTGAVAEVVRDGVPGEAEKPTRDEILSDLSRMAREAIRHRQSHTQRRRRSTTVAEIALPIRSADHAPEPPTAAASVRARKRGGTLAEDPFSKPVTVEGSSPAAETRLEIALAPAGDAATTPEFPAQRPQHVTQLAQRRTRSWAYGATAAGLLLLITFAFADLLSMHLPWSRAPAAREVKQAPTPLPVELPREIEVSAPVPETTIVTPATPQVVAKPAEQGASATTARAAAPRRVHDSAVHEAGPEFIRLTVGLIPYGDVIVDGKRVGASPATVSLRPGKHRIVGRAPGGRSKAKTINVSAETTSFVMDLRDDDAQPSP
jgi:serine/threonine protein kinase